MRGGKKRLAGVALLLSAVAGLAGYVVGGASWAGAAAPPVSAEHHVALPTRGAAAESQAFPSVAFDGTNHLAVWLDDRGPGSNQIYATRITPAGAVLDPYGIPLGPASGFGPSVAFDGTNHFVVWTKTVGGSDEAVGTRVTPGGAVLDPGGVVLSTQPGSQVDAAVASDGTSTLVVWTTGFPGDIRGTRVGRDGRPIDAAGISITTTSAHQADPDVVGVGGGFVVAWQDQRSDDGDIYATAVSATGAVLPPDGTAVATGPGAQALPALGRLGTTALAAWVSPTDAGPVVRARRLAATAIPVDGTPVTLGPGSTFEGVEVGSDGTNWLVSWAVDPTSRGADVVAARVSATGALLDATPRPVSTANGAQQFPALVFDGTNFLVLWGDGSIFGARLDRTATRLGSTPITVSASASSQTDVAVATDGTNDFVVWLDRRDGDASQVFGARVDQEGNRLDEAGLNLGRTTSSRVPDVAFDGSAFVVVWSDGDIRARRVTPNGLVGTTTTVNVPNAGRAETPAITADGTGTTVVWMDTNGVETFDPDIEGAHLDRSGGVLNRFVVSGANGEQLQPDVASDGTNALVTWSDTGLDVYGARVDRSGRRLDATAIPVSGPAAGDPSVAWNGSSYLVAWEGFANDGDVLARRVSSGGQLLGGPVVLGSGAGTQEDPAVAANGDFLVVWTDRRPGREADVIGARVANDGTVRDPGGIPIAASADDEAGPAVAASSGATWEVPYSRFLAAPPYGSTRAVTRSVSPK